MPHSFDKDYWERHWDDAPDAASADREPGAPNPHLTRETSGLTPGAALDAGCGTGAEAVWLAGHGWQVTGADISATALAEASARATKASLGDRVTWVEADLTTWQPGRLFDLVTTSYAHPTIPQTQFYRRLSEWVAPGGTLLIIAHLDDPASTEYGDSPPAKATTSIPEITGILDPALWRIDTAEEHRDTVAPHGGHSHHRQDVAVRASRLVTDPKGPA